jgi:signal transduction histidine kinase/ligand-binding sensor domain-containing protein
MLMCSLMLPRATMGITSGTQLSQYAHTAWRLDDGILNGPPRAIAQTNDGYIWIGTDVGVLRFDGVRFVPLDEIVGRPLGLRGTVWSLFGASDGSLWIGSSSHLYRWDGRVFSSFAGRAGRYDAMVEDQSHVVWAVRERVAGERQGALCRTQALAIACVGGDAGLFNSYTALIDVKNAIWTATGRALVRTLLGSSTTFAFPPSVLRGRDEIDGVGALAPDGSGGLWVGFTLAGPGLGLEHFQDGHFQPVKHPGFNGENVGVIVLHRGANGDLWVGTVQGIVRIDGSRVERFDSKSGLSGDSVRQIIEDREGDLWVVTSKGLDRFRDKSITTYSRAQHLSLDYSDAALATADGRVWTMTNTGADVLRGHPSALLERRVQLPGGGGTSILKGRDGAMWLGMDDELYRDVEGKITRIVDAEGDPVGMVSHLAEDQAGNIWISTTKALPDKTILSVVSATGHVARRFVTPLGLASVTMPDVLSGIWILDRSGHIAHIIGDHVRLEQNPVLEGKHAIGMMQGSDGTLYIWCKEGLVLLRGMQSRFVADRQISACEIHNSIFDLDGNLWAAGKCGLFRLSGREVQGWWSQPDATPPPRLFLQGRDGFEVNWGEFSPTLSRSPDGKLWFATKSGLQMLNPAHLYFNAVAPPVLIESFLANHVEVRGSGTDRLPAGTREFAFEYTALSFPNPANVLFRYKLDGFDREWQDAGTRRQASYTNLKPGRYRFHVVACNDSGVWNEQGASLGFSVDPAWYQTGWFRLATVVLILILLAGAYQIRARVIADRVELRVHERMSERMRISRELHDTLLQGLQGMVLRFSNLSMRVSADVQEEMERSLDQAESLLISGRERIKEMRGSLPEGGDLTSDIQVFVTNLFASQRCAAIVEVHGEPYQLNPIVREEILWIAREALTNSCRHAEATNLRVQLIYTPSNLRLMIEDDGKGLPAEAFLAHSQGHFGLLSMRERAEAIGGDFSIRGDEQRGTTVRLVLPARLAYTERDRWFKRLPGFKKYFSRCM